MSKQLTTPVGLSKIEFDDLEHLVTKAIEAESIERSDTDVVVFKYLELKRTLTIVCGSSNLGEALGVFFLFEGDGCGQESRLV